MIPRIVVLASGCWLWTGQRTGSGYPHYLKMDARGRAAHRVIYEDFNGPIGDGLQLDHVRARGCISKLCVFEGHMEPVTQTENLHRRHFGT